MTKKLFHKLLLLISIMLVDSAVAADDTNYTNVECEGLYRHHLQGLCADEKNALFWSFTSTMVKTDAKGKVLKKVEVQSHHGDLCYYDGKIYVAVNFGSFNKPAGKADSWVYVYKADDLSFITKHKTPEVVHGAGGMAFHDGVFIVVGGLPEGVEENYAYAYTPDFKFIERHVIKSGYTLLGVQTLAFANGSWWFGCYGKQLLKTDTSFKLTGSYAFDAGVGIVGISGGRLLTAKGFGSKEDKKMGARVVITKPDPEKGLVIVK